MLDCGHEPARPDSLVPGIWHAPNGGPSMCDACADAAIAADIAAGTGPVMLYDTGETPTRIGLGTLNWTAPKLTLAGTMPLMRVVSRRVYRGNIGRLVAITAVAPGGREWHGRHSADWCECVTMWPSKAAS